MNFQQRFLLIAALALAFGGANLAWAQVAPVFDADNLQQAFEGESQQQMQAAQEYPPAPSSQDEGFVPSQQEPSMEMAPVKPTPQVMEPSSPYLSVDQRVRKLEQQLRNLQGSEGIAKVESLQEQIQSLRGQIEQLTHSLQQLQAQQKNQYDELNGRVLANRNQPVAPVSAEPVVAANTPPSGADLQTADNAVAPKVKKAKVKVDAEPSAAASTQAVAQPNVQEEQQVYQTAYNLIKQKRYTAAISALQRIVQKYPSGQFAANAHYWLGELYGLTGKTDQALVEFSTVAKSFPTSPRVADANLKVGLILAAEFKWPEAKTAFKKVIARYPGTASAKVASEQLKQIKLAGH